MGAVATSAPAFFNRHMLAGACGYLLLHTLVAFITEGRHRFYESSLKFTCVRIMTSLAGFLPERLVHLVLLQIRECLSVTVHAQLL
jgi:hypothetical protein